jgi:hypothetical protein
MGRRGAGDTATDKQDLRLHHVYPLSLHSVAMR